MEYLKKVDLYQYTINELRPFEGELLKQIKDFYRIGLTWTSNALEGNSLTESETKVLIEDGLTVGGKPLRDMFEAVGHAKAYDYMFTLLENNDIREMDILYLHKLFYQNIEEEFAALLHKKFVFIHPYKDGNVRVARLLMNTALIQDGYLPAIIPPILRSEYISFLEKAHEDDRAFINFIVERELESQKNFLRLLHVPLPKV